MWWFGAALASGQLVGSGGELILVSTDVVAEVVADVAVVDVHQTFENPFDQVMDATYVFPLPVNAAVRGMHLTCGERVIEGEIKTKAEAQKAYDDAMKEGKRAALLEQQRENVFTQRIGGLCPGETVEVSLQYVEDIGVRDGVHTFVFPTTMGDRYDPQDLREGPKSAARPERALTVELSVHTGVPLDSIWSDTYPLEVIAESMEGATIGLAQPAVPDADVQVSWKITTEEPTLTALTSKDSKGDAYVALTLHPPLPETAPPARPRELVFVLDSSCSMMGEPWEAATETVATAVKALRPGERFNLVRFSSAASAAFPEPVEVTGGTASAAMEWMRHYEGGGTNMKDGLLAALNMPGDPEALRMVVLLTDGYIGSEKDFFGAVVENATPNDRIFGLGIGSSVNRLLIDGLAHHGRGVALYQLPDTPIEETIRDLYRRIDRPVLTDVQLDWGELEVDVAAPPQDLFLGQPLQVSGRVVAGSRGTVTVSGTIAGQPWSTAIELDLAKAELHEAVPTLWARERIGSWMFDLDAGEEQQEERIGMLAVRHHLVSPFTSLVAVDSQPNGCGSSEKDAAVPNFQPRDTAPVSSVLGSYGAGGMGMSGHGIGGGGTAMGIGGLGTRGVGYGTGGGSFGSKGQGGSVKAISPVIMGSLDKSLIQRVIGRHLNQIRYCYQRELSKDPKLAGRMTIRFTIGADGSVTAASPHQSTLGNATVEACIVGRFQRMKFPQPPGGGAIQVSYPLVFSPS